jgi:hypothetical protein
MDRQQFNSISPSLLATVIMPAQQRMHALSAANPTDAESSIPLAGDTLIGAEKRKFAATPLRPAVPS